MSSYSDILKRQLETKVVTRGMTSSQIDDREAGHDDELQDFP